MSFANVLKTISSPTASVTGDDSVTVLLIGSTEITVPTATPFASTSMSFRMPDTLATETMVALVAAVAAVVVTARG